MERLNAELIWNILNKVAIIVTILGIPTLIYGLYSLLFKIIKPYDMYQEPNSADGDEVVIGSYSYIEMKRGKKKNPLRQYHKKGFNINDANSWK